jgi:hypothetical protein
VSIQNARRRYSLIVHHAAWLGFWNELQLAGVPRREAVRFVSASQPHAGDVFNAVPMRRDFRVPTWAMRIIVQRRLALARLGLPLDEALASGEPTCTVRGGRTQDPMGDSASNIGRAGHNQRHQQTVCCGSLCSSHAGRVGHAGRDGAAGSPRLLERLPARRLWPGARQGARAAYRRRQVQGPPLFHNVEDIGRRGAFVGFGATPRPARGRTSLASHSAASRGARWAREGGEA